MSVSFPRLPRWLCGGSNNSNTKKDSMLQKVSSLKKSSNKKLKRGRGEEEKIGNVVFPEPDDPEWSIGWVEPHGSSFKTDDDDDGDGFVVLVPCYKNKVMTHFPNDGKVMEQWLSSMGKKL